MRLLNIDFIFKLVILCSILEGAQAWFFWDYWFTLYFNVVITAISIIYFMKKVNIRNYNIHYILCLLILTSIAISITDKSINGIIGIIITFFPFYILLGCDHETINKHFIFCQKCLSFIFVPSIILHIILLFSNIPPLFISTNDASIQYSYNNYIILVKNFQLYEYRFCSIFLEPGYLGTLCAFMLFADNYNFSKKANKIILITLLFSMSLAGYLTAIIGYIALNIRINKKSIKKIFILVCLIIGTYLFSQNYNNGDNNINHALFERLVIDEDKGIKGNNRFTETTDEYFEWYLKSDFFGIGLGEKDIFDINNYNIQNNLGVISGAGYKIYLLKYGILRLIFIFIAYLLLALRYKNKKYSFIFLLLIILTFIQAAYPLSTSWLIPYTFGLKKKSYHIRK